MLNSKSEIQVNFKDASLEEAIEALRILERRKRDFVVPVQCMGMGEKGEILVQHNTCTEGVIDLNNDFVSVIPNHFAHGQIAGRFKIPVAYWRRMVKDHPALAAKNFNGWINHEDEVKGEEKSRRMLVRTYMDRENGREGTLRALLSDRYMAYDNIDVLAVALKAMKKANERGGVELRVDACDLTDTRLFVRVVNRKTEQEAPRALKNYVDPNDGRTGGLGISNGIVSGFVIKNSEVGAGSLSVAPRAVVLACRNGLIWKNEGFSRIHLGGKMQEGEAIWSDSTKAANVLLIEKQLKDVIKRFCSEDFIGKQVGELEEMSLRKLAHPVECINNMASALNFSESERDGIFADYLQNTRDNSVFSIAQAVTSFAQRTDVERRYELEMVATGLMDKVDRWDVAKVN